MSYEDEISHEPEPHAAEITINVATYGGVVVLTPEEPIESEAGDETPEVEIIVRAKGSVAVSLNIGSAQDLIDHARIGTVRHDGG